jgi:hypothetical protein
MLWERAGERAQSEESDNEENINARRRADRCYYQTTSVLSH